MGIYQPGVRKEQELKQAKYVYNSNNIPKLTDEELQTIDALQKIPNKYSAKLKTIGKQFGYENLTIEEITLTRVYFPDVSITDIAVPSLTSYDSINTNMQTLSSELDQSVINLYEINNGNIRLSTDLIDKFYTLGIQQAILGNVHLTIDISDTSYYSYSKTDITRILNWMIIETDKAYRGINYKCNKKSFESLLKVYLTKVRKSIYGYPNPYTGLGMFNTFLEETIDSLNNCPNFRLLKSTVLGHGTKADRAYLALEQMASELKETWKSNKTATFIQDDQLQADKTADEIIEIVQSLSDPTLVKEELSDNYDWIDKVKSATEQIRYFSENYTPAAVQERKDFEKRFEAQRLQESISDLAQQLFDLNEYGEFNTTLQKLEVRLKELLNKLEN
jgi:polyhydroxyalkanoate synthesis regulator phasin